MYKKGHNYYTIIYTLNVHMLIVPLKIKYYTTNLKTNSGIVFF